MFAISRVALGSRLKVPPEASHGVAVACGAYHTCVVRRDGRLVCFGRNGVGQCTVPSDIERVVAVSAGAYHTCVITGDGRLVCFGGNGCWAEQGAS